MYNILVVDDERIHREGLIMLLEKICPDDMLCGLSTLFQTNFFRLFFRYCTGV